MIKNSTELNTLADLIFKKTGLAENVINLTDDFEYEFEGKYERIKGDNNDEDEEEDYSVPYYGGTCYIDYELISDGQIDYSLGTKLTDKQKQLLLKFSNDGKLIFNIERVDFDFEQVWNFSLMIPHEPNVQESEIIELEYVVKATLSNNECCYSLECSTEVNLTDDEISQIAVIYSLML